MITVEESPYLSQANWVGRGINIYGAYDVMASSLVLLFDPAKAGVHTFSFLGKQFTLPNYVEGAVDTSIDASEFVGETRDELQNSLAVSAKVDVGVGAFTGQVEAAYGKQFAQSSQYSFAYNNAFIQFGKLSLKLDTKYLTDNFLSRVAALPEILSGRNLSVFADFFDDFGAYFTSSVCLGGKIEYNVSVSKSSLVKKEDIAIAMRAEYKAITYSGGVSAEVKRSSSWSSYQQNRSVSIRAAGGDVLLLAQLANMDPDQPGTTTTVRLYNDWAESLATAPAITSFQLTGIWELCGTKGEVVRQAFVAYGRNMRPRLDLTVSATDLPAIVLGEALKPIEPPATSHGYQMVVLDRSNPSPGGVRLNKYYTYSAQKWQSSYRAMYAEMLKDIREQKLDTSRYVLILASFGVSYNAPPTPDIYPLLFSAGAGPELTDWLDSSNPGSTEVPGIYAQVGIFASGMSTGVSALAAGKDPKRKLIEVFFYNVPGSELYTLATGRVLSESPETT